MVRQHFKTCCITQKNTEAAWLSLSMLETARLSWRYWWSHHTKHTSV